MFTKSTAISLSSPVEQGASWTCTGLPYVSFIPPSLRALVSNAVGVMTGLDWEDTRFKVKHAAFWQVPLQLYCPATSTAGQHRFCVWLQLCKRGTWCEACCME